MTDQISMCPSGTTHSDEKFLNTPERITKEILDCQAIIKSQQALINSLKGELETHFENGSITTKFKSPEGVTASRCTRSGKWHYSSAWRSLKTSQNDELKLLEEREQECGIAKQDAETVFWMVRLND